MEISNGIYNDPQGSNNSLFSTELTPLVLPQKSKKKSTQQMIPIYERILQIQHQLVSEISIIAPIKLKASQFIQELKNFRYEKTRKTTFGDFENKIEKDKHSLILMLTSIFNEFKNSKTNVFYIVFQNNAVMYFSHQEINQSYQSFLVLSSKLQNLVRDLQKEQVDFDVIDKGEGQKEKILLKNRNIAIFWGYFVNYILTHQTTFETVSNFSFINSTQVLPHEIFNGSQKREQFQYLAKSKSNILGQGLSQLYLLKLEGLWLRSNLQYLLSSLKIKLDKSYQIIFGIHPSCKTITNEIFLNQSK